MSASRSKLTENKPVIQPVGDSAQTVVSSHPATLFNKPVTLTRLLVKELFRRNSIADMKKIMAENPSLRPICEPKILEGLLIHTANNASCSESTISPLSKAIPELILQRGTFTHPVYRIQGPWSDVSPLMVAARQWDMTQIQAYLEQVMSLKETKYIAIARQQLLEVQIQDIQKRPVAELNWYTRNCLKDFKKQLAGAISVLQGFLEEAARTSPKALRK